MTRDEGPRFVARQPSRISQTLIHAADLIEVSQVVWCADDSGDGSMAVGCRADVDELDSIGAGGDQAKLLFDAVGCGDLRIAFPSGIRNRIPDWASGRRLVAQSE